MSELPIFARWRLTPILVIGLVAVSALIARAHTQVSVQRLIHRAGHATRKTATKAQGNLEPATGVYLGRRPLSVRGLLIRQPWIDMILDGDKTWEIRGSRTKFRERIALIASGSGTVIGVCDLVDCLGPLTAAQFRKNAKKAGMRPNEATLGYYPQTYAWILENACRLRRPVPYLHPPGAVIWVQLDRTVEMAVLDR